MGRSSEISRRDLYIWWTIIESSTVLRLRHGIRFRGVALRKEPTDFLQSRIKSDFFENRIFSLKAVAKTSISLRRKGRVFLEASIADAF